MGVKKNFIYNTIYQLFLIILPLITVPYISRVLGAEGVGEFAYTGSYAQYFILLGMIGISLYGNRQIAYVKNDKNLLYKEFSNILLLQITTTIVSYTIYFIIFVLINNENKMLYFIQSIPIIATTFDITWFFVGYEDMKSVVTRNSIMKIIGIILVFLLVKESSDVWLYALILGLTGLLGQCLMWVNLKGKVKFIKPSYKEAFKHFKPAVGLFVSQLAIQVYTLLDRTMLGIITNEAQVGLYDNSQKTIKLVLTLVTSLGVVMLPKMSSLYSQGKTKEFKSMIYKAFNFVNFLSFPLTFGLIAIADGFSIWFYGDNFLGIDVLLKVGALMILAISWSNVLGIQVMLPMGKEKQFTLSVTMGAIVNFILNLILIRALSSIGTMIASLVSELIVTIAQLYFLREVINIPRITKTVYRPLMSSIIMYVLVKLTQLIMPVGFLYSLIQIFIGGFVYIGCMYILKDKILKQFILEGNQFLKGRR